MNHRTEDAGLSKSALLQKFWTQRHIFLGRTRGRAFNWQDREDIFQEACLRFLASTAVFHHPEAAASYLHITINSLVADHFKRIARLQYRATLPGLVCEPLAGWHCRMMVERLDEASRQLSCKEKKLLAAWRSPDLSLRQISRILGIPYSTARYRMDKIVRKLRRLVSKKALHPSYSR